MIKYGWGEYFILYMYVDPYLVIEKSTERVLRILVKTFCAIYNGHRDINCKLLVLSANSE